MYIPIHPSRSSTGIFGTPTKTPTMLLKPMALVRSRWQFLTLLLISLILLTNIYKASSSLVNQLSAVHDDVNKNLASPNSKSISAASQHDTATNSYPGHENGIVGGGNQVCKHSNISPLIHQNYFLVPTDSSIDAGAVNAYHVSAHSASWQNTPFAYNFYSEPAARSLLPLLREKLPKDAKYSAQDYMRVWDSLPLGMLRADFWRYIVLFLYGGVYVDLDVKLVAKLPWAVLCEDGARSTSRVEGKRLRERGRVTKVKSEEVDTQLIVGIEGDNTMTGLSRGLQIVSWTIASAPAHPAALCAMEHVVSVSPDFLDRHAREGDIERYIMDWTGPGVWTDCVLAWLNSHRQEGDDVPVEDTLHELKAPKKVYDTLVLPRTAFAVLQGMKDGVEDGVLVKHYFEGMWKATWSGKLWKSLVG